MTGPIGDRGAPDDPARLTAWVHGVVQGVGFRWWTRTRAAEHGLAGSAKNLVDGRVEIVVEGPRAACQALLDDLRGSAAPGSVDTVIERWDVPRGATGFQVR